MKANVVVLFFFISIFPQIHGKLTRTPSDTVASLGSTVTLECFTENKHYPPTWTHKPEGSTDFEDVYLVLPGPSGGIIGRPTAEYYERFKVVENRETGDYSLEIRSVKKKDAGIYACTARGGLGEQATAGLTVINVKSLECIANTTQVLGHSICQHEPDFVSVSCRFVFLGQTLPSVTWVRTDQPEFHRKTEVAHWTMEAGKIAESSYVIRGNEEGLNGSSFACIISDAQCTTPAFNVITIHNVTEVKTVNSPEEVYCPFSLPHQTGCRWVRRKAEETGRGEVVSENRLLNLHRPDMTYGTYVCIVECNLGGDPCPVEALTVSYQPLKTDSETDSASIVPVVAVVVVVVVCALISAVILFVIYKRRQQRANKEQIANGQAKPMMPNGNQPDSVPGTIGSRDKRLRQVEEKARRRMNAKAEAAALKTEILANGINIDEAEGIRHRQVETKEDNEREEGVEE